MEACFTKIKHSAIISNLVSKSVTYEDRLIRAETKLFLRNANYITCFVSSPSSYNLKREEYSSTLLKQETFKNIFSGLILRFHYPLGERENNRTLFYT